jgi:phosphoglycerol transferase MdoB-like AlkP superfamily enzyme
LPFDITSNKKYSKLVLYIFCITNSLIILISLVDIISYEFTNKHSAYDFISLIFDLKKVGFKLILEYIWTIPLMILFVFLIMKLYPTKALIRFKISNWFIFPLFLIVAGLLISMARGGWYLKPITPSAASKYLNNDISELALNSPYSFIYSIQYNDLEDPVYIDIDMANNIYPIKNAYNKKRNTKNVVLIILESVSQEFLAIYNEDNITHAPFLDSLSKKGMYFINSYANARTSINGLVSIMGSLPNLMEDAFLTSKYQSNQLNGIGSLLSKYNYTTSFYHGAFNGTMYFDNLIAKLDIDEYFGINEYPNKVEKDFDGTWGIFDEPYLNYWAEELNKHNEPFLSCLFTITTHHPFVIPEKYNSKFKEGSLPIHKTLKYTDHALRNFFNKIKTETWYNNTLFIITSDHTSQKEKLKYKTMNGKFLIPLILYAPGDSTIYGKRKTIVNQIDIIPSIIDYLGINDSINSFGRSVLSERNNRYHFNYTNGQFYILNEKFLLTFDGGNNKNLYLYKEDMLLKQNVIKNYKMEADTLIEVMQAIIKQYNYRMINNKLR